MMSPISAEKTTIDNGRQSNIELLRILCIIGIILFHIVYHNDWSHIDGVGDGGILYPDRLTIEVAALQSFLPLGVTAVDLFLLITGYFLINSNKIKLEKISKMWLQMLFYSVAIAAGLGLYYGITFSFENIFDMFTPVMNNTWWFCSSYIFVLILSPFINLVIRNVDRRILIGILVFLAVFWFAIPMVTGTNNQGSELLWFIVVYSIGGLLRLNNDSLVRRPIYYLSIAAVIYLLFIGTIFLLDVVDCTLFPFNHIRAIISGNSIFTLLLAIPIFLCFKNITLKENRVINYVASMTLGIYLIHEHPMMYEHVFSMDWITSCTTLSDILVTMILVLLIEYVVCFAIETVRKAVIDGALSKVITKNIDVNVIREKKG